MTVRPRLLFVGAFPPRDRPVFGGMVTSCRALLQSSFAARVELRLLDTTQISNPPPALPVRFALAGRRFADFVRLVETERPDAVLMFAAIGASLVEKSAMAWYARLRGVPALLFPRGGAVIDDCRRSRLRLWLTRAMFRGAKVICCQSQRWHDFVVHAIGFEPSAAPVITNWTATPELVAIARERPAAARGIVRVLFLGWLDREKGVLDLLDAFGAIAHGRSVVLDFAGEGNVSSEAREFAARSGLGDRVRFRGWLHGPAVFEALASADVLVLPSWAEGLPNAMVEAMSAGLAVVVSAVGSVPDVATDGVDALVVPPRDPNALRSALTRIVDDPALRERLGRAAAETAVRRFGVEPAAEALAAAVQRVISMR